MGRGPQEQVSKASWRGAALAIATTHRFVNPADGQAMTSEMTQVLSLESPETLVIETTRPGRARRRSVDDSHDVSEEESHDAGVVRSRARRPACSSHFRSWARRARKQTTLQSAPPNIVLIFPDNIGVGEVGVYGGDRGVPTPRLDGLAREGMRLTNFNSNTSACRLARGAADRASWRSHRRVRQSIRNGRA